MAHQNTAPFLAISLVLLMGMSGCTGLFDDDESYEMVSTGLGDVVKRSIGSPNLEIFSDCNELEMALSQKDNYILIFCGSKFEITSTISCLWISKGKK